MKCLVPLTVISTTHLARKYGQQGTKCSPNFTPQRAKNSNPKTRHRKKTTTQKLTLKIKRLLKFQLNVTFIKIKHASN